MDNNFNNIPNNGMNNTNNVMGDVNSTNMNNEAANNQFGNVSAQNGGFDNQFGNASAQNSGFDNQFANNQYQTTQPTNSQFQNVQPTNNQYQTNQFGNNQMPNNSNGYGNVPPVGNTQSNTNPPKKKGGAGCIIAVIIGVVALLVIGVIIVLLLILVPSLNKYVDKSKNNASTTEYTYEPTTTEDYWGSDPTTESSTTSVDIADSMVVGNESVGYISVPANYKTFTNDSQLGGDPNYVQYCDPDSPQTIITVQAYTSDGVYTAEDLMTSMYDQLLAEPGVDASSITTSSDTLGSYEGYLTYAYFPDDDIYVYAWATSETDDGLIHYVAIEFPSYNSDVLQYKDTFSIYY